MAAKTEKGVLNKALRKTEALLRDMVAMTLRNDLTRNQRTALETCITIHMHQKVRYTVIVQSSRFAVSMNRHIMTTHMDGLRKRRRNWSGRRSATRPTLSG